MISGMEIVKRLILSAILGGLIGVEREVNNRPAGLRTHILVTLGSTLVMLISVDGLYIISNGVALSDPYRLAAQVVSGIGFLGAGTIMRTGNNINGLTTAASLWVSAGIGLAIGIGYYLGAIVTVIVVLITLMSLGIFEKGFLRRKYKTIEIIGTNRPGLIGEIGTLFGKNHVSIKDISIISNDFQYDDSDDEDYDGLLEVHFIVKIPNNFSISLFDIEIYQIFGVRSVIFEGATISHPNSKDVKSSLFDLDEDEYDN